VARPPDASPGRHERIRGLLGLRCEDVLLAVIIHNGQTQVIADLGLGLALPEFDAAAARFALRGVVLVVPRALLAVLVGAEGVATEDDLEEGLQDRD
jgi:hypothetical protein